MKKVFIFIFLLSVSFLYAQEETIFGSGEVTHGGFGGPVIKLTEINGQTGVLVGGRGGWIINNTLVIGGGGYGLANEVDGSQVILGSTQKLNFGYGGFEMEYIINSDKMIHATVGFLIGGGGVNHRNLWNDFDFDMKRADTFFITEPFVSVEANILSYFRICAGGSYRYISGIDETPNLGNDDFSGVSAFITFKFGKF